MGPAPSHRELIQKIEIALPSGITGLLGSSPEDVAACLKKLAFIELFRRGEISTGYAAEVLGMDRWAFIQLLGEHGVPYVDMPEEEVREQVELVQSLAKPHQA